MDSSSEITFDGEQRIGIQKRSVRRRFQALLEELTVMNVQSVADRMAELNPIEGRSHFCEAVMRSQMQFPQSTNVYAALVAAINPRFPDVGYLVAKRAAVRFREACDSRDRDRTETAAALVAHLANQAVVHAALAWDVLMYLLTVYPMDNTAAAAGFCIECGSMLRASAPQRFTDIVGGFRRLLRGLVVDKPLRRRILKLIQADESMFEDYPAIIYELDLVEAGEQVTHMVSLLQPIDPEYSLDSSISSTSEIAGGGYGSDEEVSSC
ncbi:uncharacterized protein LOC127246788 [Andrographis paniculata]|uniref:uncharacterized protein LOC127246788 n=1 Tax=Andrographis paniculata TaxID=175694 RepID=UPI0021E81848|nr:uncharacterized protein LOC127246788 [Andrographis paniculata]